MFDAKFKEKQRRSPAEVFAGTLLPTQLLMGSIQASETGNQDRLFRQSLKRTIDDPRTDPFIKTLFQDHLEQLINTPKYKKALTRFGVGAYYGALIGLPFALSSAAVAGLTHSKLKKLRIKAEERSQKKLSNQAKVKTPGIIGTPKQAMERTSFSSMLSKLGKAADVLPPDQLESYAAYVLYSLMK